MKADLTRGIFNITGTKPSNDLIISLEEIKKWMNITNPSEASEIDFILTTLRDTAIEVIENEILNSYVIKTDMICKLCFFSNKTNIYATHINQYRDNVFFIDKAYINEIYNINYIKDDVTILYDSNKYQIDKSNREYTRIYCADKDNRFYFPNPDTNGNLGIFGNVFINFQCGLFSSDLSDKTSLLNRIKHVIMEYVRYKYEACDNQGGSKIFNSLADEKNFIYSFLE